MVSRGRRDSAKSRRGSQQHRTPPPPRRNPRVAGPVAARRPEYRMPARLGAARPPGRSAGPRSRRRRRRRGRTGCGRRTAARTGSARATTATTSTSARSRRPRPSPASFLGPRAPSCHSRGQEERSNRIYPLLPPSLTYPPTRSRGAVTHRLRRGAPHPPTPFSPSPHRTHPRPTSTQRLRPAHAPRRPAAYYSHLPAHTRIPAGPAAPNRSCLLWDPAAPCRPPCHGAGDQVRQVRRAPPHRYVPSTRPPQPANPLPPPARLALLSRWRHSR